MANSIFKDGGGAGIGSYVVVFKNGELAPETSLLKLRRAYEAGESIFFSVIDIETKDALIPASGWIDEESKLHLVARDFDDVKTYSVVFDANPIESQIDVHVEVKDGVDLGGEDIPSWDGIESALAEKADLVDGKIPAEELPSYVDDVEEYEDLEHFPAEGERGKIYVALDTGFTYRWSGTQYIQIGGSDLSAGDGINIADHIVSADMDYLNEHLNFATPDEVESKADKPLNTIQFDIPEGWDGDYRQLLENQDSQLIKKFMGGLDDNGTYGTPVAIYDQLGNWYEFTPTSEVSAGILIKPNQGDGADYDGAHVLLRGDISLEIDPETGDETVLTTELVSDGYALWSDIGRLSRELGNKADRAALENKADKPLNTMQFNVPAGWEGDITQLLEFQNVERFKKWVQMAHAVDNYCIYDQLGNYYEFLGIDDNHARLLIKPNMGDSSNDDGTVALASCVVSIEDEGGEPRLTTGDLILINHRLMPVDTIKLEIPEEITHLPNEWTESDLELVLGAISPQKAVRINEAATANGSAQFYDQFEHHYLIVPSGERFIWYVSLAENYNYGNRFGLPARPQFYAFAVKAEARTETGSVTVTSLGNAHYATDRDLASKQDTLVSGTNIKTINGNSVLGEGDITISSGTEWTVITSDMTNDERKAALQNATLPFIISTLGANAYQYPHNDSDYFYFYNCIYAGDALTTVSYKVHIVDGTFSKLGAINSATNLDTNVDDSHFPTSKAVVDYIHSYVTLSNISSGDVIPSSGSFWNSVTKHYDVELNGARLHYMTEDDMNYQYGTMTMNGTNIELNLVTFNKTTRVVTFNTATTSDYYTKSEVDAAIQAAIGDAIGGGY